MPWRTRITPISRHTATLAVHFIHTMQTAGRRRCASIIAPWLGDGPQLHRNVDAWKFHRMHELRRVMYWSWFLCVCVVRGETREIIYGYSRIKSKVRSWQFHEDIGIRVAKVWRTKIKFHIVPCRTDIFIEGWNVFLGSNVYWEKEMVISTIGNNSQKERLYGVSLEKCLRQLPHATLERSVNLNNTYAKISCICQ